MRRSHVMTCVKISVAWQLCCVRDSVAVNDSGNFNKRRGLRKKISRDWISTRTYCEARKDCATGAAEATTNTITHTSWWRHSHVLTAAVTSLSWSTVTRTQKTGIKHGRQREFEVGATWGQGRGHRGQGKSLWVDKMSTREHFTKTNISPGATGGKGKSTGDSCACDPSSAAHGIKQLRCRRETAKAPNHGPNSTTADNDGLWNCRR